MARRGEGLIAAVLCLLAGLVLGAACLAAQGPLPGDVALTRALQSVTGEAPAWAALLTGTAKAPAVWLTLLLAAGLAYARGGRARAGVPILALIVVYAADAVLRALIFVPKPTADLVAVAAPSAASGLPSTFALVYGSLFGAVVFAPNADGVAGLFPAAFSGFLIAAGCCARIAMGGHWTSQLAASLLISFSVVLALHQLLGKINRTPHSAQH